MVLKGHEQTDKLLKTRELRSQVRSVMIQDQWLQLHSVLSCFDCIFLFGGNLLFWNSFQWRKVVRTAPGTSDILYQIRCTFTFCVLAQTHSFSETLFFFLASFERKMETVRLWTSRCFSGHFPKNENNYQNQEIYCWQNLLHSSYLLWTEC